MSGPAILAESVYPLSNLGPGRFKPDDVQLKFSVSGGTPTVDAANSTVGLSVVQTSGGKYTVSFPGCRFASWYAGNVAPASPDTASNHRSVVFDEPDANGGTVVVRFREDDGSSTISAPVDGSVVTLYGKLDLG